MLRDKKKKTEMGKTNWRRTTKSPTWHKFWLLLFSTITQAQLKSRSINLTLLLIVQLAGVNEGEFNSAGCQFCDIKTMNFYYYASSHHTKGISLSIIHIWTWIIYIFCKDLSPKTNDPKFKKQFAFVFQFSYAKTNYTSWEFKKLFNNIQMCKFTMLFIVLSNLLVCILPLKHRSSFLISTL
jgi:hypothetical protein